MSSSKKRSARPARERGVASSAGGTRAGTRAGRSASPAPTIDAGALTELALDLRWSWNHSTDELWAQLEPDLWDRTHNPWVVLQTASPARLEELLAQPEYTDRVARLLDARREYLGTPAWFQQNHTGTALTQVAYFSMEFGLSEALPIYSGGLGNVAGDQLKAASDLGVPVVGIGLLYQQGYFRQAIRDDGSQEALYPYNEPGQLPITPARDSRGEWVRLKLTFPAFAVWLRAWHVQVGRLNLYLLDSNDPANSPADRAITSELYGGGAEHRLRQELVLGIGGWRLLRAFGLDPEVCHLNEGHAAFAVLERARTFMVDHRRSFHEALAVTRAGNVFTTHTPVAAGFDRFRPDLVSRYLQTYAEKNLGLSLSDLLALGREQTDDGHEPFNMAYLAIRGSAAVNGVSRLHGAVSRRLFQGLFPRWPQIEVPVGHVTNGVHVPTWDSPEADALWSQCCGCDRWRGALESVHRDIRRAPDRDLWALRNANRKALVDFVRGHMAHTLAWGGSAPDGMAPARPVLDPDVLTLGFARRFATYKRPNLLLHDPERLLRLLGHADRPMQLIVAGKAHPSDEAGQELLKAWVRFTRRPEAQGQVIFLPDYDLCVAERLVQGVDVWINTPRRPWEASGTSGMKVLVNGGLNLSELDGWWAEAYAPEVGWALGDGREHGDDATWDAAEAEALYALIEDEIAPAFYTRGAEGVPTAWTAKMRESMSRLTPRFSANRAVREYTEQYYLPAATAYRTRAADRGALGAHLLGWQQDLARCWPDARFGAVRVETRRDRHEFTAEVWLGRLDANAVSIELFADATEGDGPVRVAMKRGRRLDGGGREYRAAVPAARPAGDYTARLVPHHAAAVVPLEAGEILWQR